MRCSYKELCPTEQELSVFLSAATPRFHRVPWNRHQVLQDYVLPSRRAVPALFSGKPLQFGAELCTDISVYKYIHMNV